MFPSLVQAVITAPLQEGFSLASQTVKIFYGIQAGILYCYQL